MLRFPCLQGTAGWTVATRTPTCPSKWRPKRTSVLAAPTARFSSFHRKVKGLSELPAVPALIYASLKSSAPILSCMGDSARFTRPLSARTAASDGKPIKIPAANSQTEGRASETQLTRRAYAGTARDFGQTDSLTGKGLARVRRFVELIKRDLQIIKLYGIVRREYWQQERQQLTVTSIFDGVTKKHPDKTAIISDVKEWTFIELQAYANRVGNFLASKNIGHQDVVAVFGPSSVEYVGLWLGISKVAATAALVNSNLVQDSLLHSLNAAKCTLILIDTELKPQFDAVRSRIPQMDVIFYSSSQHSETAQNSTMTRLEPLLNQQTAETPVTIRKTQVSVQEDVMFYIFTSGTTGMPKPCLYTQRRFMTFTRLFRLIMEIVPRDVIYCPLPLYHTAGGIVTIGQMLLSGSTVVICRKFSAKKFWEDVVKYKCTVALYIGEICRFLLAQPVSDLEKKHQLRLMTGQGVRPAIWKEFQSRFSIPKIIETYGSTEGIASFANMYDKVGAIGYLSPTLSAIHPQAIIRVDKETGEPIRNDKGFCERVVPGEEGELFAAFSRDPLRKFDGYTSKEATASKILSNVLRNGDQYFRTGDMMTTDEEGFVYFVDRLGDSYRWKGENIASAEVETIVSSVCGYTDVAAYGVQIPGTEGKAGMVCIAAASPGMIPPMDDLPKLFAQKLPTYAIPLFIRIAESLQLTGTFKFQKNLLKTDGYDPSKTGEDNVYFFNQAKQRYEVLSPEVYDAIQNQKVRF